MKPAVPAFLFQGLTTHRQRIAGASGSASTGRRGPKGCARQLALSANRHAMRKRPTRLTSARKVRRDFEATRIATPSERQATTAATMRALGRQFGLTADPEKLEQFAKRSARGGR